MKYLVVHPYTHEVVILGWNLVATTIYAIRRNKADLDHPAYRLYEIAEDSASYKGELWRAYGEDFDIDNCWKTYY